MQVSTPEVWLNNRDLSQPFFDELHIWFVDLDETKIDYKQEFKNLSLKDKQRFESIQTENKRELTIKRYVALLKILSYYLRKDIGAINLEYSEFGKPYINSDQLKFNVSNSFNYLLVGITQGIELGVDVEKFRSNVEFEKLVERYFTITEKDFFTTLPEHKKEVFFFDLWTMKEAVVKATGLGMRLPLNSFEFPFEQEKEYVTIQHGSLNKYYYLYKCLLTNDTSIMISLEQKIKSIKYFRFD